jgi:hypothetical protein
VEKKKQPRLIGLGFAFVFSLRLNLVENRLANSYCVNCAIV